MLILAQVPGWIIPLAVLFIAISVLLILIILVQKGKGGGLGGAFGGAGGGGGLLGTKTGDFLTWVTIGLVILFFFFAIILVKYGKPRPDQELMGQPAPQGTQVETTDETQPADAPTE